jgi:multidrug efflux pump subunit AcrB
MSLISMPQELTPEIEIPLLIIITSYPGAGPEDVERLVSKPVEASAATLNGVSSITSNSMENMSLVIIQYEYGANMNNAYSDVKTKLDSIVNRLPDETGAPMVLELDINAMPVMRLSVTSETKENLLAYVNEEIVPKIEKLSSVSQVTVSGGRESYVRVELIEERLHEYGISMPSVISAVSTVDYASPLGYADFGDLEIAARTQIKYESINSMRNIPISLRNGDAIRLSDVANIYMASQDASSISRYNGHDDIGISIQKRQSSSADRVSRDVATVIDSVLGSDSGVSIAIVSDTSEDISASIMSIIQTMILAIVLSMLVLYLFLGDLRASLIVASSMPVSLLVTFSFMNLMGYSLNMITMSGLVLGVGMMVDNSIVVTDSCFKSTGTDKTFAQAAIDGTKFVLLSVLGASLTTIVVFLPLAFIRGMVGQMFGPLSFSIVFALVASLFSAITLVPLFFSQFKPVERKNAPFVRLFRKVEHYYAKVLKVLVRSKKTVITIAIVFFAVSCFLATQINMELIPNTDQGIISISVGTKPGLKLEKRDEIMTCLETMVANHPDVDRFSLSAGGGGMGAMMGGGSSSITAYLIDKPQMSTDKVIEQWRRDTGNIVDCDIDISSSSSGPGGGGRMSGMGGGSVEVRLAGDDFDNLREGVAQTVAIMGQHPDIIRVSSSVDDPSSQAEIVIDPLKAASMNLTPQLVSSSIYTALNGSKASEINIDGQKYTINVVYPSGRYESVSDVMNMMVVSALGVSVPLSEVASIEFSDTPQTIVREEGEYTATITGSTPDSARFTAQRDIDEWMSQATLPRGVSTTINSQTERMNEELGSLLMAIIVAVLLVFSVMAIQFESFRFSLMVMICVPFAVIGAFGLLFLTGMTLNMASMLGFLILVGIVVNNGILFVGVTNKYRQDMDVKSALLLTGETRLRPILLTALTTSFSMLPLALGMGSSTEMMQGLGVVVIGGLIVSTLMALLFLPTFYLLFDGNPEKRAERSRQRMEKRERIIMEQQSK